jgi:hypothetical protein
LIFKLNSKNMLSVTARARPGPVKVRVSSCEIIQAKHVIRSRLGYKYYIYVALIEIPPCMCRWYTYIPVRWFAGDCLCRDWTSKHIYSRPDPWRSRCRKRWQGNQRQTQQPWLRWHWQSPPGPSNQSQVHHETVDCQVWFSLQLPRPSRRKGKDSGPSQSSSGSGLLQCRRGKQPEDAEPPGPPPTFL